MRKRQYPAVLIGRNEHVANSIVSAGPLTGHGVEVSRNDPVFEELRVVEQGVR